MVDLMGSESSSETGSDVTSESAGQTAKLTAEFSKLGEPETVKET